MRPPREKLMISEQLKLLEDRKRGLETVISEIDQAREYGENWLKGTETSKNFRQTLHDIEEVIESTSRKCREMADENSEEASQYNASDAKQYADTAQKCRTSQKQEEKPEKNNGELLSPKEKDIEITKLMFDQHGKFINTTKGSLDKRFEKLETEIQKKLENYVDVIGSSKYKEVEALQNQLMEYKTMLEKERKLSSSNIPVKEFAGFHARINSEVELNALMKQNYFNIVTCNVGNCYDPSTGVFTAPHSGPYVVSISLDIIKEGLADIIIKKRDNKSNVTIVGIVNVGVQHTNASTVLLVEMFKMEEIYLEALSKKLCTKISSYSSFLCFSL